jgi:O-antigen/teichoic acid export membrane protein
MSNSLEMEEVAVNSSVSALPNDGGVAEARLGDVDHDDLKARTAHGALVSLAAQAATFVMRTGSMMVLARLLTAKDFGLVGMVTAITGGLALLKDAGLSAASVQRASVTREQTSTLFWINLALGGLLAVLCVGMAPALVAFYGDQRLFWVMVVSGTGFIFNGAAAQHQAMLQRSMRFGIIASVNIISLALGIAIGVGLASAGWGYWALVMMAVSVPVAYMLGTWLATGWVPRKPQRRSGIRSMLMYGGTLTLNNLVVYVIFNADKVLLGRFFGAEALGIYGRAYQLINLPTDNLNATIGSVAFPALSRLQHDPPRLRSYFIKGYSVFLSLVMPVTLWCALFANDIILVMLGPKWHEAAPIFRSLAPTILIFGLTNPFSWLLMANGQAGRLLRIGLVVGPVIMLGYILGLGRGPQGVAIGLSLAMLFVFVPLILWAKQGTLITLTDVLRSAIKPALAVAVGLATVMVFSSEVVRINSAFLRLSVESSIFFGVYLVMLLGVMRQMAVYQDLIRTTGLWSIISRRSSAVGVSE